jgi:hypothetical protein
MNPPPTPPRRGASFEVPALPRHFADLLLLGAVCFAGCSTVPVPEQRLTAKSNMQFADTAVFRYQSKLWPQTEPGSAFSGGAAAGGCTSCR